MFRFPFTICRHELVAIHEICCVLVRSNTQKRHRRYIKLDREFNRKKRAKINFYTNKKEIRVEWWMERREIINIYSIHIKMEHKKFFLSNRWSITGGRFDAKENTKNNFFTPKAKKENDWVLSVNRAPREATRGEKLPRSSLLNYPNLFMMSAPAKRLIIRTQSYWNLKRFWTEHRNP